AVAIENRRRGARYPAQASQSKVRIPSRLCLAGHGGRGSPPEAATEDAPEDAQAVAEAVEATVAMGAGGAPHRHLDDAAAGAQHAEQEVDLDVEAVRGQMHAGQCRSAQR